MSWFVLMEMTLVAVMTVYLAYHTHLVLKQNIERLLQQLLLEF